MYLFPGFPSIMWLVWVIRSTQRLTWSHSWLLLSRVWASRPWKNHSRVTSAFLWCVVKWRPRSVLLWSSLDFTASLFSWKCVCTVALVTHAKLREKTTGYTSWDMLAEKTPRPHAQESFTVTLGDECWWLLCLQLFSYFLKSTGSISY